MPLWRRVEDVAREAFRRYGYREIRTPIFEKTELFARGVGEATDIVHKEMYTFVDRARAIGDEIDDFKIEPAHVSSLSAIENYATRKRALRVQRRLRRSAVILPSRLAAC